MINTSKITPFLRWTGSKRWLVRDYFEKIIPADFNNYYEPFLGGGAMFFHVKKYSCRDLKREYFLSDCNEELINCFIQLRDNPIDLIACIKSFKNSKKDYYEIRNFQSLDNIYRASKFIYLNRTSFNGIYRVNKSGIYNVPYGNRPNVDFVTEGLLNSISEFLQNVNFGNFDFEHTKDKIRSKDLIFIDPPYTIAHENNGFVEYNQKLFSWEDQIRLRNFVEILKSRNVRFIITNAYHPSILELYKDVGNFLELTRDSIVGGRLKTRGRFRELVITG